MGWKNLKLHHSKGTRFTSKHRRMLRLHREQRRRKRAPRNNPCVRLWNGVSKWARAACNYLKVKMVRLGG